MLYGMPVGLVAGWVPAAAPILMFPARLGTRWVDTVAVLGARLEPEPPAQFVGWGIVVVVVVVLLAISRNTARTAGEIYLLTGDDESLVRTAVADLVHDLVNDGDQSIMVDEFDGDEYELRMVVDAAQTMPFLTDKRVVVARNVSRFNADDLPALLGYLGNPLDTSDLVLAEGGEGRMSKKFTDGVKSAGTVGYDGTAEEGG